MELELLADKDLGKPVRSYVDRLYSHAENSPGKYAVHNKTEDYNVMIGILIGALTISSGNIYASALGVLLGAAAFYQAYKARCPFL